MNLPAFISRRILKSNDKTQISRPIVRIATIGIAIGVALMLLSLAVVKGFQTEIRNKVIGFGSHFQIVANERSYSRDSQKLTFDPEVYRILSQTPGVKQVQVYATKPGILETKEALQGVIIKGIAKDFDWTFLKSALTSGEILTNDSATAPLDIIISGYLAQRMKLKVGDKTSLYLFNDQSDPRQRNFTVKGIYDTGLENFDKQFVFVDLSHVQRLSGWGLQAQAVVDSMAYMGTIGIGGLAFGGEGELHYQWTDKTWRGEGPHFLNVKGDTSITLVVSDESGTIPDTAFIRIDVPDDFSDASITRIQSTVTTSGGSEKNYIGGYEVQIQDYEQLIKADDQLFASLSTKFLQTQKITDRNPEIFSWLQMLDINVDIIIILMVVISIVNMTSALLIIILERQNMIGTLKALGMSNLPVMVIFTRNAASIIGKGILWGNILGLSLAFIQWKFGVITLNSTNYYVDKVPIQFDLLYFFLLDLFVIVICVLFMLLPAYYVTKISPIKAIRFN